MPPSHGLKPRANSSEEVPARTRGPWCCRPYSDDELWRKVTVRRRGGLLAQADGRRRIIPRPSGKPKRQSRFSVRGHFQRMLENYREAFLTGITARTKLTR